MLTKVKTRRDAESTNVNAESIKTRYTPHRNSDRDIYIFLPGEISSRRRGLSEQSPCIVEMICWVVVDFSAVKLRFGLKQKAQDGLPSYLNPPSVRPPHHLIQSHNNHLEGGGGGGHAHFFNTHDATMYTCTTHSTITSQYSASFSVS